MRPCLLELITEFVKEAAASVLRLLDEFGTQRPLETQVADWLEAFFAYCLYLMQTCQRYPEQLHWLIDSGAMPADAVAPGRAALVDRIIAANSPALGKFGVANMRMQDNLGKRRPGNSHLKNEPGGVADVEFMVQYLVLAHVYQYPELLNYRDNVSILNAAARCELMNADECEQLKQHYLISRSLINRQALRQKPLVKLSQTDNSILEPSIDSAICF